MACATSTTETAAAVTIHRGELAQIRNLINISKLPAKGDLYGLWTHSFQPVVQLVVGSKASQKHSSATDQAFLNDNYGICLLGKWYGFKKGCKAPGIPTFNDSKRCVNVVFVLEGQELSLSDSKVERGPKKIPEKGQLEIIPGQSSFRLCENILEELKLQGSIDVTEEDREAVKDLRREADVKEDQWYSTEDGKEILKFLCQNFPNMSNMQLLEISRDTETHNIGFSLKYHRQQHMRIRLEFPANFPKSPLSLLCGNQEIPVAVSTKESNSGPEDFAQFICGLVLSKLDEHIDRVTERAEEERKKRMKAKNAQGGRRNSFEMKNDHQVEGKKAKDHRRPQGDKPETTHYQNTDNKTENLVGDQKTTDRNEITPQGPTPENFNTSTRKTEEKQKTAAPSHVGNSEGAIGSKQIISENGGEDAQKKGDPMEGVELSHENSKNADSSIKGAEGEGKTTVPSFSPNGEGLVSTTSSGGETKQATTANENSQVLNRTGNGAVAKPEQEHQNNEDEPMDIEQ